MIKVFYGKKGTGKTKHMLEAANAASKETNGSVVYIDDSNELLVKLSHKIRFINILDNGSISRNLKRFLVSYNIT